MQMQSRQETRLVNLMSVPTSVTDGNADLNANLMPTSCTPRFGLDLNIYLRDLGQPHAKFVQTSCQPCQLCQNRVDRSYQPHNLRLPRSWTSCQHLKTSCRPPCQPCANLVQTSCQPHANLMQNANLGQSCQPRADLMPTSCQPQADLCQPDLMPTSCRPHANLIPSSCQPCRPHGNLMPT